MPFTDGVHMLAGGIGADIQRRLKANGGTGPGSDVTIRAEVLKRVFLDCTGDGDLAAWAGAPFEKGDEHGNMMAGTLCSLWADIDWPAVSKGGPGSGEGRLEEAFRDKVFTHEDRHLPGMFRVGQHTGGGNIGHTFGLDSTDERSITQALLEARQSLVESRSRPESTLDAARFISSWVSGPLPAASSSAGGQTWSPVLGGPDVGFWTCWWSSDSILPLAGKDW